MRRTVIWLGFILLLALAATPTPTAWAQRSVGVTLFNKGLAEYEKGNYRESLRMFQQCLEFKGATALDHSYVYLGIADSQRSLGQFAAAEENYKKCLQLIDTLPEKQRNYVNAFNDLALLYQSLGRFPEAEGLWQQSEQYGKKGANIVLPVNNLARHYSMWGKQQEQEAYVEKAEKLASKFPKTLAMPFYKLNLGMLNEQKGRYKEAEQAYLEALATCIKDVGADHYYNGQILLDLAELYRKESRYADAEKQLLEAQRIYELLGKEHPELLRTQVRLAQVRCEQGRYADARRLIDSALKAEEAVFGGQNNSYVASAQDCLGTIYRQDGRYDEAQKVLEKSLATSKQVLGQEHLDVAVTMRHLAFVHEDLANYEKAEELLKTSQDIISKKGPDHPARAASATALAHLYLRQGKNEEAEPLLKQALALSTRVLGADSSVTAAGAHDLGELYLKQKKFAEAQTYLEQALAIDEKLYGANAPQIAADLTALATAYGAQGNSDKAEPLLRRAAEIKNVLPGGKSDRLAIPEALVAKGNDRPVTDKWALVIGISNFKDSSINLKYAAKDATDFKNFLVTTQNFKSDHVKLLTDEAATRDNVIGMLGDKWLSSHVKPDDLVVVFVSSHGSDRSEDAKGTNFLIAHDTNKNSLLATGIPMQWLTKIVTEQVKSDRVILILDVCHSGSAAGQKGLQRAAGLDPRAMNIGKGQMVICSSLAEQVSWESKNYENSVFTRRLIEALHSDKKNATMLEAYKRLKVLVESEVLRDRGNLQTPVLVNTEWTGGDVVLSIEPARSLDASTSK